MRNLKKIIAIITQFKQYFGIFNGLEVSLLVVGGALLSLLEMVSIAAMIPVMLIIFDPNVVENSRFMGALYRFSGIDNHVQFAVIMSLAMIGIFTIKLIFNILLWHYEFYILRKWRMSISMCIFNAIINADYQKLLQYDSSSFVSMLSDSVRIIISNFFHNIVTISHIALTSLFLGGFLLFYSAQTALIVAVFCGILLYGFIALKRKKLRALGAEHQALTRENLAILHRSIFGVKEIKIAIKQSFFSKQFENMTHRSSINQTSQLMVQHLPAVVVEFIFLTTVLFAFVVTLLISEGVSEAIIQIALLVFVGARLMPLLNRAIFAMQMISTCPPIIANIFSLYKQLTPESVAPATKDLIALPFNQQMMFQNVSFAYQQEKDSFPVLDKVSLHIAKGQHIGLVGASGAGKSTIINIMLGFLPEFQGVFKIDETPISTQNINAFRKILSFVDQQPFLLDDDYIANIAYGEELADIDMERLKSCLEKVGLLEHAMASETQLATKIGENGKYLSGGQKQRLAIARALYRDAQILILDEASSALDMDSEIKITELLDNLKGQITIISIAHRLSTLKNCDKIFYMEKGHIAAEGTFSELYKTQSTFKRYIDQAKIDIQ